MTNAIIAVAGAVCLLVALGQSWLIVGVLAKPEGPLAKLIPNSRELIRSHIDFLMMAQFLFVFYGLFRLLSIAAPVWLVVLLAFGSFFNPFSFFVRAFRPAWIKAPPLPFMLLITTSCIATTIGYAVVAVMLALATLAAA